MHFCCYIKNTAVNKLLLFRGCHFNQPGLLCLSFFLWEIWIRVAGIYLDGEEEEEVGYDDIVGRTQLSD